MTNLLQENEKLFKKIVDKFKSNYYFKPKLYINFVSY